MKAIIEELKEKTEGNHKIILTLAIVNYLLAVSVLLKIYMFKGSFITDIIFMICVLAYVSMVEIKWKVNKLLKGTLFKKYIENPIMIILLLVLFYFLFLTN
ncbi:hypothetical protein [Risungbinella massiliensis]|uniref:hypothetical protein n=1 Tax=Risungbinella massiliensis TaxID=1329796 RepID=UPI0005CB8F83|nr:hypothetical protein [Risungbinella massiliensis]